MLNGQDPTHILARATQPPLPYTLPWEAGNFPWPDNTPHVSNLGGGYPLPKGLDGADRGGIKATETQKNKAQANKNSGKLSQDRPRSNTGRASKSTQDNGEQVLHTNPLFEVTTPQGLVCTSPRPFYYNLL